MSNDSDSREVPADVVILSDNFVVGLAIIFLVELGLFVTCVAFVWLSMVTCRRGSKECFGDTDHGGKTFLGVYI